MSRRSDRYFDTNSELEGQTPEYQQAWRRARHQVRRMRGWYIHALVFTAVVGFFWLRYLFGGSLGDWSGYGSHIRNMPIGMTLGWGLGLTIHGLVVFGRTSQFGPFSQKWEDQQMQRLLGNGKAKSTEPQ